MNSPSPQPQKFFRFKRSPIKRKSGVSGIRTQPSSLRRKPKKTSKKRASKKLSQAAMLRLYDLPPTQWMRYKGLKGIYWAYLARYVRRRDASRWGTCVSCGRRKTYEELQAGHFAPAGSCGFDLLFDEQNLNGECAGCNGFDSMHLLGYAKNLDLRYGTGTADSLKERYDHRHQKTVKEWTKLEYESRIQEIRAKLSSLGTSTSGDII